MSIPLNKHVKVWVNATGIIPQKIINRLLLQREIRPLDQLTFFTNNQCLETAKIEIQNLEAKGIKVKSIELNLSENIDDPYLVQLTNTLLNKLLHTKEVKDAVFFTTIFRLMNAVQNHGLYSDNDVMFLNKNFDILLSTDYLYGNYDSQFYTDLIIGTAEEMYDLHIFGIDATRREEFYAHLIIKLKEQFHLSTPPDINHPGLRPFPAFTMISQLLPEEGHGHLSFPKLKKNIVAGKDNSHCGGEKLLFHGTEDALLEYVKNNRLL